MVKSRMRSCFNVAVRACLLAFVSVCMRVCLWECACKCMPASSNACMHVSVRHVCVHAYMYVCICVLVCVCSHRLTCEAWCVCMCCVSYIVRIGIHVFIRLTCTNRTQQLCCFYWCIVYVRFIFGAFQNGCLCVCVKPHMFQSPVMLPSTRAVLKNMLT